MCRVQVVYYLSHGGRMEQPHLIEVEQEGNRLCLSEVKKRLTVLRGKGMPDAFSWAYKRSYKNDFIWNDVTENDLILPLRDNEYIIKGSENVYGRQESRSDRGRVPSIQEEHKDFESPMSYHHHTPMRASEGYDKRSSLSSSSVAGSRSPRNRNKAFNCEGALRVNRQLMETLTQAKTESMDEVFYDNPHSDGSSNGNTFTDVKVYKTPASPVTADHGKDAATQTEEHSGKNTHEFQFHRDVQHDQERSCQRDQETQSSRTKSERAGLVSTVRKQLEESSRKQTSTAVLRQLLSCGGIDTNTCSSMQYNRLHYPPQAWAWSKSKADTRSEAESASKIPHDVLPSWESPRMPARLVSSSQDPESIPEVVKETTNSPAASHADRRSLVDKASREEARKLQNSMLIATKEARKVEDNSPRLSPAIKRVNVELPTLKVQFSPPKKEMKCKEDRPLTPGRSRLDWEKTLQEAVNASSPPVDFRLLLQECPQCGRTFKPDSLKVHLRGCHGQKTGKITSVARRLE
ncbi:uncharacterized protein LOC9646322 [Selaginella moellendorffii]|uniref:uncharacterized protein LOC9646322 n=1 Tax=Selaginella moellendorffii TaxID=88036 RepID=UPI000D1CBF8B|nr:uncharacterized protein LOC9646322 [Selaginella moellendorffii]|eukprot:XP_024536911.1 uncharacterized protein LOC9646322 [Selaginella moellendorffii]